MIKDAIILFGFTGLVSMAVITVWMYVFNAWSE